MQAMNGMRTSRDNVAIVLVALGVIWLSVGWGTSLASAQGASKRAFLIQGRTSVARRPHDVSGPRRRSFVETGNRGKARPYWGSMS